MHSSSVPAPAHRRVAALLVAVLTLLLTIGLAIVPVASARADSAPTDPNNPATPTTVTNDVLPTVQLDGVAWAQVVVGNTVYVAGKFTTARPYGSGPGVNTVSRNNLLAYDITTGNLITSFAPSLNAQALAISASPDGSRIYVAGDFTSIDGAAYYRLAAFSTATGKVIPSFRPVLGSQARSVTATNSSVYVGGVFTSVNGQSRGYGAQLNASDGSLTAFDPKADSTIQASALTADGSKLIVGGRFASLSGSTAAGLGAVDPTTGSVLPWGMTNKVRDFGTKAAITSLTATADRVYGSGYDFGSGAAGTLEGVFSADPTTGNTVWIEDCHGDTYSVYPLGNAVYAAGHPHYCGNIGGFPQTDPWTFHHTVAFSKAATGTVTDDPYGYTNWAGNPSPSLLNWFPQWTPGTFTGQSQAAWSVAGNSQYLAVGGEFTAVNGVTQQGLMRFAVPSIAPNKSAPNTNSAMIPRLVSDTPGTVRVGWTATFDNDNDNLTYSVVRDKSSNTNPIYTTVQASNFYTRPLMSFTDTGLTPGSSHYYRVFATDPYGNVVSRVSASITVASTASQSAYSADVHADGASSYWPLDETSGNGYALDHVGADDLTVGTPVTRGTNGPITGTTASSFSTPDQSKAPYGLAASQVKRTGPQTFTASAWFRTTSTSGGKIIGFGNQPSGSSGSYDRHIYLDANGAVWFGVYPGSVATLNSGNGYNDGAWHQVTASLGADGMKLWVDAKLAGSRGDVTSAQSYDGYWRIGGDNTNGWPNAQSAFFTGDIAQAAIYPTVLSRSQVIRQYVDSGRTSPVPAAPTDSYGKAVYNLDPTLFWRLGDSGTTVADSGQQLDSGTYEGDFSQGVDGPFAAAGKGVAFHSGRAISSVSVSNPTVYTLEGWFKTTTTRGGKLIGFGNASTGNSSAYDRHIYMRDDGHLDFGVWTGQTNIASSPTALNDGRWHYLAATQGPDGMTLYVDGSAVATNPQTQAQDYSGYWRIGGDWTWNSSSDTFDGALDEMAVYPTELSASDIANHYALGSGGTVVNAPPKAAFTATPAGLAVNTDGTASTDSDGTVASYAWSFGDGGTAAGSTASHTYAGAGTFTVTLTVTDDKGATDSVSHDVTVAVPNSPPTAAFTATSHKLTTAFDGTGSTDADGTVASWNWVFGDGTNGSGASVNHQYPRAGTYSATLTVTDDRGATSSTTKNVTVVANVAPTASFTTSTNALTVSTDASASSDADGTIASYAWDFGDGANGTGSTANHAYASPGTYTIGLTVTDDDGTTATTTRSITVVPSNQPPVASFTSSVSGLTANVDASASSDPDGSIDNYTWDFGDSTSANGVTASHTYLTAGTYTVSLTVLDNRGGATSTTQQVTVTAPPQNVFALDGFGRTVSAGWGSADAGGAWTLTGTASTFSVNGSAGQITNAPGATRTALLGSTSTPDADVTVTTRIDSVPTGGGEYLKVIARQTGTANYTAQAWIRSNGSVTLLLQQGSTVLKQYVVPGLTVVNGSKLRIHARVSGSAPSTLQANIWADGTAEPSGWQASVTDSTGPQGSGSVGLQTYLSGSATLPVSPAFDDLTAQRVTAAPVNAAPTAAFTATTANLAATFDGTGSTDSDGTVAGWSWAFGDGTTGSGSRVSHAYGAPGTYTVTLTATDDKGATGTASRAITVTAPAGAPLASDAFARTTANAWGTADSGGAWTVSGTAANWRTDGSSGLVSTGAGITRTGTLGAVSATSTDTTVSFTTDAAPTGGGTFVSVIGRSTAAGNYQARVWLTSAGGVQLQLLGKAQLSAVNVAGLTYQPGTVLDVRLQVFGSSPTTVRAKVWAHGTTEPAAWQLTTTDTQGIQTAGATGLGSYVSASATTVPVTVRFTGYVVRPGQ